MKNRLIDLFDENDFSIVRIRKRGVTMSFVVKVDRHLYEISYGSLERILAMYDINLKAELYSGRYRTEDVDTRSDAQKIIDMQMYGKVPSFKRAINYPQVSMQRLTLYLNQKAGVVEQTKRRAIQEERD